jgi:hypothetical protein
LFQLLFRAHLAGDTTALVMRRILVFILITWLPLLVLSAVDGRLFGPSVTVPFLLDVETHIRFLIVVPLLLAAEPIVHARLHSVARSFLERDLIPDDAMQRFEAAVNSAFRLRNSILAEMLLIAFVYAVGVLVVWRHYTILHTSTWYGTGAGPSLNLSHAGLVYAYVSLPVFQFLLLRWYFRLSIWIRFLWQVSRIRLVLVPTHPDQLGGLGFLANTVNAFSLLLLAHGAMLAAQIANRIFFVGARLTDFKFEIAAMAGYLICLVFGPLLVFSPQLAAAKRKGIAEYGTLAERYVRGFDEKWLRGGNPGGEPLLGHSDIQSLADMGNSYSFVRSMRLAPVTRDAVLQIAAAVLLPLLPLLLTMMSIEELARRAFGLVF